MKRGRPTGSESINLNEKLYKYYSRGISAETVSYQLNLNRKTVYAYYKKFSDRIQILNEKNFFQVLKSKIKQHITSYDNLLLELYSALDSINNELEQKNVNRQSLQNQKLAIIREIRNTINQKVELEQNTPQSDTLDDAIKKEMSKHEKS